MIQVIRETAQHMVFFDTQYVFFFYFFDFNHPDPPFYFQPLINTTSQFR